MTGPSPRQTDAAASSDERIIQATLALIARDGVGAVTMRGIAETAGVSRQTLYNHYPDLDSIVAEAVRRHNAASIELLESSLRVVDTPQGKLEQLVRHAVSIGAHAEHTAGLQGGLSADARATLRAHDESLEGLIRDVLAQGRADGVFRQDLALDLDPTVIRTMLSGLAELAASTPQDAAVIASTGARTVLAAVAARGAEPPVSGRARPG